MTREDFILILNKELSNELAVADVIQIIRNYCIDKDAKDLNLVDDCINILVKTGQWKMYFEIAKNYYHKQFTPNYLSKGNILICYL